MFEDVEIFFVCNFAVESERVESAGPMERMDLLEDQDRLIMLQCERHFLQKRRVSDPVAKDIWNRDVWFGRRDGDARLSPENVARCA